MVEDLVSSESFFGNRARFGLTSRNVNLRMIAAVHNALNQALASPGALHIESRMADTSDSCEINRLSRLGVRDDPNLEVTPTRPRLILQLRLMN